jgi:hypothetical protein
MNQHYYTNYNLKNREISEIQFDNIKRHMEIQIPTKRTHKLYNNNVRRFRSISDSRFFAFLVDDDGNRPTDPMRS